MNRALSRFCRKPLVLLALSACAATGLSCAVAAASQTVTVYGAGLSVATVLNRMAQDAGVRIVIGSEVEGTLDLSLKDVPLETALEAVCSAAGLKWQKQRVPEGGVASEEVYVVQGASDSGSGKELRPKEAPREQKISGEEDEPAFRPLKFKNDLPEREPEPAPASEIIQQQPARELKLNAAQIRMVLQGVPPVKRNSVLNYWRQRAANNIHVITPAGQPNVFDPRYMAPNPQYPYGRFPPDVKYYFPDGSVWRGYPFPYQRVETEPPVQQP